MCPGIILVQGADSIADLEGGTRFYRQGYQEHPCFFKWMFMGSKHVAFSSVHPKTKQDF